MGIIAIFAVNRQVGKNVVRALLIAEYPVLWTRSFIYPT